VDASGGGVGEELPPVDAAEDEPWVEGCAPPSVNPVLVPALTSALDPPMTFTTEPEPVFTPDDAPPPPTALVPLDSCVTPPSWPSPTEVAQAASSAEVTSDTKGKV
jgi:hypothetical protein